MEFKVYTNYEDFAQRLNFYVFKINQDGSRELCTSIDKMEFQKWEPGATFEEPTLSISGFVAKPFMKAMAETLKEIGIKPDGEPVLENELVATKYHLEDMRRLVFSSSDNSLKQITKDTTA
ncbi:MAG: hypothetical protein SVO01_00445 [Thermotogota bacterium]|nr:hypothetical protein [Thermotogota bacterium]